MPYVRCPSCGLRSYSAARFSNRDTCPRCHKTFVVIQKVASEPEPRETVVIGGSADDD